MKHYLQQANTLDELVDVFDELPVWSAPFGLKLLEYMDYRPGISVLDIGCGAGFPLTEIAMRLGETCKVYGIDPWKAALERTRKKVELYGIRNVTLFEGMAESIPLPDQSIHMITSNNGINNVQNMEKAFAECSRILVKGGQLIQTMNTDQSMFEFYSVLESVLRAKGLLSEIDRMHDHIRNKRPPVDQVLSLMQRQGFVVRDLEVDQFNYRFTDGSAMFNHYFIRVAFMRAWMDLLPGKRIEEIFSLVESWLNEQADLSGGLKLSIPFVLIRSVRE